VTYAWQEPVTALLAQREQRALEDQLEETTRALSPAATPGSAAEETPAGRMSALADRLDRKAGGGDALGRIQIPAIDLSMVFVSGATTRSLRKGPGHYDSTVLPGQPGTVGVAGHRTTYSAPFRKLDRLDPGDEIVMTMPYGRFAYVVKDSLVVSPSRISVLRLGEEGGLVLTTCTPLFSAAKRLVIVAGRKSAVPLGAAVGDPFPYRLR
jgi:sortase A